MDNIRLETQCPFDPMSPDVWRDPYPFYAALRRQRPVAWVEPDSRWHLLLGDGMTSARGFWMLTSFDAVSKAMMLADLGHQIHSRDPLPPDAVQPVDSALVATIKSWPLFLDAPHQARLKKPLTRGLNHWSFDTLRHLATRAAANRLDALKQRAIFDIVADFGYEIPMRVICTMIGVDEADHAMLTEWSYVLYAALEFGPADEALQADGPLQDALDYFRTLLVARQANPKDDLISILLSAGKREMLSDDEILANCILLVFAGHDTTLNVISSAALALLEQPHHLARFSDKGIGRDELLEFLRHESPQQLVFRYALRDIAMDGQTISQGDLVCLSIGAANRDPAVFDCPDILDFDRGGRQNLIFGKGIHACPGSSLALATGGASLDLLVQQLPHLEVISWDWGKNAIVRGLRSLEVRWRD